VAELLSAEDTLQPGFESRREQSTLRSTDRSISNDNRIRSECTDPTTAEAARASEPEALVEARGGFPRWLTGDDQRGFSERAAGAGGCSSLSTGISSIHERDPKPRRMRPQKVLGEGESGRRGSAVTADRAGRVGPSVKASFMP
jgi:hypothetical protein